MRFSLIIEMPVPKAYDRGEYDAYWQAIEQVKLAEQVGFHGVWAVEHHVLPEFSACSAPEIFLAALSQHTKTIRIGHGVVLLPMPFNHPIRVAERIAALDILSNGRVEFGTGRAISPIELNVFGISPEDTRAMWEEAIRMIPRMWRREIFSHQGRYLQVPPCDIVPKPLQKPHPPIWVAGTQPATCEIAGRLGIGILCFGTASLKDLEHQLAVYRQAIAHPEPIGAFVNSRSGVSVMTHCGTDDATAKRIGVQGAQWFFSRARQIVTWDKVQAESYRYYRERQASREAAGTVGNPLDPTQNDVLCVGDPESCAKTVRRYEALGIDDFICYMQMGDVPHAAVMDSIRIFGQHVIPQFQKTPAKA